MTYACPAWEFTVDTDILKMQSLKNKVLRTVGNFARRTPPRELHVASKSCMYVIASMKLFAKMLYVTKFQPKS